VNAAALVRKIYCQTEYLTIAPTGLLKSTHPHNHQFHHIRAEVITAVSIKVTIFRGMVLLSQENGYQVSDKVAASIVMVEGP
jgi:hypothetical protein